MLVARSPPPPLGVSVAKHRAPVLQTCGLGRASSDTSKNFRFEVQTCSWRTVIGASCPPAPQSYRCLVILTEPRGSANQIIAMTKRLRSKETFWTDLPTMSSFTLATENKNFFLVLHLWFFAFSSSGILCLKGLHCHSGTDGEHCGRFLANDLGAWSSLHCDAEQLGRGRRGACQWPALVSKSLAWVHCFCSLPSFFVSILK